MLLTLMTVILACRDISPKYHDYVAIPGAEHLSYDFRIDNPNILLGEIGHFELSIRPSIRTDTYVAEDVLDKFSVTVRENGSSWANVAWIDTNDVVAGMFPGNHTMGFKHRIFTEKKQQSPNGPLGSFGFGVLVDRKGRYNLDLKYGEAILATREFRIK